MIFNSIIAAYRNRHQNLKVFLESLKIASQYVDKDSFEIVITELAVDPKSKSLIDSYSKYMNIKHFQINYTGIFWKSKALNHSALKATGTYLTMIDIDALVPPQFLIGISEFFSSPDKERTKLCHRVRFLDPKLTKEIFVGGIKEGRINKLIKNHRKFRFARERYTMKEMVIMRQSQLNRPDRQKMVTTKALGNSHFTMKKETYMAVGGYDETFVGWACEDLDFNLRVYKFLRGGRLREDPKYIVFSLHHERKKDWFIPAQRRTNERIYENNKKQNIIKLPISESWGKF